jgi:hypothetical protein
MRGLSPEENHKGGLPRSGSPSIPRCDLDAVVVAASATEAVTASATQPSKLDPTGGGGVTALAMLHKPLSYDMTATEGKGP